MYKTGMPHLLGIPVCGSGLEAASSCRFLRDKPGILLCIHAASGGRQEVESEYYGSF